VGDLGSLNACDMTLPQLETSSLDIDFDFDFLVMTQFKFSDQGDSRPADQTKQTHIGIVRFTGEHSSP